MLNFLKQRISNMVIRDNNVPAYQQVVRKPNVMITLNPLKKTTAKVVNLDQRMKQLGSNQQWQNLMQAYKNQGQKWNPSTRPRVKMVTLDKILIDEDIQRSLDRKHAVNIADPARFDPRLMQVIFCVKTPGKEEYHAVDGQHTATVLALLIANGLFDGETDWRKVEVSVSYVETADKSFARNAFALINGRGKKKISNWYQHRTRVQSVRIDGSQLKEDVEAEAKQTICEQNLCFPVDKDSDLGVNAGAFTHMEALNLDVTTL
jgi:hypothetical protein